jgi:hypothetical protein
MTRIIVATTPFVSLVLQKYLEQQQGQYRVIPQLVPSKNLQNNYIAVETTPQGARLIEKLLDGIGTVNEDKALSNPSLPITS